MTQRPFDPAIIVTGSPRYLHAFDELLGIEGGFVDDPVDRGGATKYGISLRFLVSAGKIDENADGFADYDLDMDGDIDGRDIRKLTVEDAYRLYHQFFWEPLDCESFPKPLGEALFDQAVNGGLNAAKKLLQQAVNACLSRSGISLIAVDGSIGPATRAAVQRVIDHPRMGINQLMEAYREAVRDRYRAIVRRDPRQRKFLRGWLARAERLGR